jgi:hypothetical protein
VVEPADLEWVHQDGSICLRRQNPARALTAVTSGAMPAFVTACTPSKSVQYQALAGAVPASGAYVGL